MKISIIVPVFNSENCIERCVNSVILQKYDNWELILIDDGSSDRSYEIIKNLEQIDSRIVSIHQSNQGAGIARNKGLERAQGEYIVFLDSDDYIENCYLSMLSKHKEDVVFIDVNRRNEDGKITHVEKLSNLKKNSKDDIIRSQMTGKVLWGGVRKAVKRTLLQKHNIRFSNHTVGEEAMYSFLILYYATSFSFLEKPVYNYVVHPGSLSQTLVEDPWGPVVDSLKRKIIEMNLYDDYYKTINAFYITAVIISLDRVAHLYKKEEFLQIAEAKYNEIFTINNSTFCVDYKHMKTKAVLLYPLIKYKWFNLFYYISSFRR